MTPSSDAVVALSLLALAVLVGGVLFAFWGLSRGAFLLSKLTVWAPLNLPTRKDVWVARIDRVVDGDTFDVEDDYERGHGSRVRIWGIDAPSRHSDKGKRSTTILEGLLKPGEPVTLRHRGTDRYNRMVCQAWAGAIPVGPYMRLKLAACRWSGKGKSPLQKWWSWQRWIIGPPG